MQYSGQMNSTVTGRTDAFALHPPPCAAQAGPPLGTYTATRPRSPKLIHSELTWLSFLHTQLCHKVKVEAAGLMQPRTTRLV